MSAAVAAAVAVESAVGFKGVPPAAAAATWTSAGAARRARKRLQSAFRRRSDSTRTRPATTPPKSNESNPRCRTGRAGGCHDRDAGPPRLAPDTTRPATAAVVRTAFCHARSSGGCLPSVMSFGVDPRMCSTELCADEMADEGSASLDCRLRRRRPCARASGTISGSDDNEMKATAICMLTAGARGLRFLDARTASEASIPACLFNKNMIIKLCHDNE